MRPPVQLERLGRFETNQGRRPPPPKTTIAEPVAVNGKHGKFVTYKRCTWFKVGGAPYPNDGYYYKVRFIFISSTILCAL
jgi:hypothetical protein